MFTEAGLRNQEDAHKFCLVNGGLLVQHDKGGDNDLGRSESKGMDSYSYHTYDRSIVEACQGCWQG